MRNLNVVWKFFHVLCILLGIFSAPISQGSQDGYLVLKQALAAGNWGKAEGALKLISQRLTFRDARFHYYSALIHFLNENYQQVRQDLEPLIENDPSDYKGKMCHLWWMSELFLSDVQKITKVKRLCSGILAQENNQTLYWYNKVSLLKLSHLEHPWPKETTDEEKALLKYRPISLNDIPTHGSIYDHEVRHFRQWIKLNHFHQQSQAVARQISKASPHLMEDEEVDHLAALFMSQSKESSEEDSSTTELNSSVYQLAPLLTDGQWEEATQRLEKLALLYPYSFRVHRLLTLLYWLTGKGAQSATQSQIVQRSFSQEELSADFSFLNAYILLQNSETQEAKKFMYGASRPRDEFSTLLKYQLWSWIDLNEDSPFGLSQAAATACELGDVQRACPLADSYWRQTQKLTGAPPSLD